MNQLPNTKTFDEFLEHYGVLGMRWGFRKDRNTFNVASASLTEGAPVFTYGDASPKYSLRMANVANKARNHLLSKSGDRVIKKVNKRHANVDLTDASNKRKYLSDLELQLSILATDKVPLDLVGHVTIDNSYNGELTIYNKASYNNKLEELRELNHSDDQKFVRASIIFDADSEGFIVGIQHIDEVLEHSDIVGDFLEHYGVKGMKWGERKDPELTELDAMLADLMAVNNSNYGPFAYMLAGMDQKKKMQWLQKNFTQMSGKGKESLAKYNSVLHNVNEYMTKNKIVNRPSDPKEQKVWAEKRKKDLAASHAEFLERKQKGQNLINPNVEISARKEVRSDGSVRLSTKPRIDEIVKPKSKKGDPVIPKNPHFPMPIKHSEVVGDFLEHYGVKGMKWGVRKDESGNTIEALASIKIPGRSESNVDAIIKTAHPKSRSAKRTFKDIEKITFQLQKDLYKSDAGTNHILDTKIKYMDADFSNDKVYDNYLREVSEGLTKVAKSFTPDGLMSKVTYDFSATDTRLVLLVGTPKAFEELVHENSQDEIFKVPLPIVLDENRFIVSFGKIDDVEHSNVVGDFLEHYGVLGMKWGVRKDRPNSRLPKHATFYNTDKATGATTMVDYNPRKVQVSRVAGGGIQVTGRSQKEVKRVSEEIRRQLSNKSEKKSVTSKLNLTDDELRATINRMQLEKTYAQLTATPKQSNAMQQFMVNTGSQILGNAITNVGTEYLKQFLKVNIDKKISPEFRISKLKTEKK